MSINALEKALFDLADHVKLFNEHLTAKYQLEDIPFNVKGRDFPKKGIEIIKNDIVKYQFHGGGCTLNWDGIEISYNIDVSSVHSTTITSYEIGRFMQTSPRFMSATISNWSYEKIHQALELLEKSGILMTRKPSDLGSFHINEIWYDAFKNGKEFTGANKDEIDWL